MRYCQACHRCYGDGVEFCLFDHTPTRIVDQLPLVIDGKYRLEQLIAQGGMGAVYRATHQQLDRAVAIKILRPEFLSDPTVSERFNREARAAARLKHPNIVSVYDFGLMPNGGAYLVMELIEGRSLREEMKTCASRHGQMRPERAAAILAQVCAGIEAAHRQGIVHRDLKPDNVMIEPSTDGVERLLVLDFGIAKLKDREHALRGLTDENTVIGTPSYISPEQCTGQPVDPRSDIYSLGVMLYEMLTGRVPFSGQNTSSVLLRHLQEPPAPPGRFRAGLSDEMEQVVLRALAKNPDHRFQSASQFAEQLTAAAGVPAPIVEIIDIEPYEETRERPPRGYQPDEFTRFEQSPNVELPPIAAKAPTLLIERSPRTRLYASFILTSLVFAGSIFYFLQLNWDARANAGDAVDSLSPQAAPGIGSRDDKFADEGNDGNKARMIPVKNANAGFSERAESEARAVYAEWAASAARGDWSKHMSFYAENVDYFRDGLLSRGKIETRKRRIFGGLDAYSLRFTERPQAVIRNDNQEADLFFDRHWVLRRGRKGVEGKARGHITLRRDSRGWKIVSERQIKK